MAKLYPPYIEGTIPAFYGTTLVVPLSMNKAVGEPEVKEFIAKIKTAQTGILLGSFKAKRYEDGRFTLIPEFDLTEIKDKLIPGQYYKIQVAYIDQNDNIGYYSTIGVAKYTTKPNLFIENLELGALVNNHQYRYVGVYSQENQDITERVYSYCFNLYDAEGALVDTSEDILHNRNNDIENYESQDEWLFSQDLEINKIYYLEYVVTTTNNLTIASPKYRIMQKKSIDPELKVDVIAELAYENGYVDISLKGYLNAGGVEEPVVGAFLISRKDHLDDTWNEVFRFNLSAEQPTRWLWRDFTIEQGHTYTYALQQYNDYGLYSNKILSNEVYADFEDAFLFDGKQQLKIKYNPKVSSFKNTIMETKVDTLGGKHPFIFRNGSINYKEFPISGLISYLMDESQLFVSEEDIGLLEKTTNLVSENIAAEREFKLRVLDWLTDGKPKLFRSPTEGNYIVRLMNVSLTPSDPLGRMLHTFNATAYEIENYSFDSLSKYNIVEVKMPITEKLQWQTLNFVKSTPEGLIYFKPEDNLLIQNDKNLVARTVIFRDMMPGTKIAIHQQDEDGELVIQIGATGAYQIESPVGITSIRLLDDYTNGNLTFSYYTTAQNVFNTIAEVDVTETPLRQFIGEGHDVNIIDLIEDIKTDILQFYHLNFDKRPVEYLYELYGEYYHDLFCTQKFNKDIIDAYYIYEVYKGYDKSYPLDRATYEEEFLYYTDGYHFGKRLENYDNYIYINGSQVDITDTENFHLVNMDNIKTLTIGSGVMLSATYQIRTTTYNLEIDKDIRLSDENMIKDLQDLRKQCIEAQNNLVNYLKDEANNADPIEINKLQEQADNLYREYLIKLEAALKLYKEDNAIV